MTENEKQMLINIFNASGNVNNVEFKSSPSNQSTVINITYCAIECEKLVLNLTLDTIKNSNIIVNNIFKNSNNPVFSCELVYIIREIGSLEDLTLTNFFIEPMVRIVFHDIKEQYFIKYIEEVFGYLLTVAEFKII